MPIYHRQETGKFRPSTRKSLTKPLHAAVEDDIDEDYVPDPTNRLALQSPTPEASIRANRILKYLKKAAAAISLIGDAQDVQDWVSKNLTEEETEELLESCSTISGFLQTPNSLSAISPPSDAQQTAVTIEPFGPYYILRSCAFVSILGPIETFKAITGRNLSGKTLAFTEWKGSEGMTMMCALSGIYQMRQGSPKNSGLLVLDK